MKSILDIPTIPSTILNVIPFYFLQMAKNKNVIPNDAAYIYYGHKLHMDQNEKLAMFEVTHAVALVGFSSRIVKHNSMPIKNNLTIYHEVLRLGIFYICVEHWCVIMYPILPRLTLLQI